MNHKSQLYGWAVDRAIQIAKINEVPTSVDEIHEQANALANHAYVASEDYASTAEYLIALVQDGAATLEQLDFMIAQLTQIFDEKSRIATKLEAVQ